MKYYIILIASFALFAFNTQNTSSDFVGKWQGESKNDIGFIEFDTNGFTTIELAGVVLGGEEFEMEGQRAQLRYEINDSIQPIEVAIILRDLESLKERKMLMIAEFITKDSLKLGSDFNEIPPTDFTEDNSVILTQVK